MSEFSIQSEYYEHRGPGPKWVREVGDTRITPSIPEARLLLEDWFCDRIQLGFREHVSYKTFVTTDIARIMEELQNKLEFQRLLIKTKTSI